MTIQRTLIYTLKGEFKLLIWHLAQAALFLGLASGPLHCNHLGGLLRCGFVAPSSDLLNWSLWGRGPGIHRLSSSPDASMYIRVWKPLRQDLVILLPKVRV